MQLITDDPGGGLAAGISKPSLENHRLSSLKIGIRRPFLTWLHVVLFCVIILVFVAAFLGIMPFWASLFPILAEVWLRGAQSGPPTSITFALSVVGKIQF